MLGPSDAGAIPTDVRVLAMCSSVLYLKFLATTMIQGRKAFRAGSRTREDNKLPMANGMPQQTNYGATEEVPLSLKQAQEDELRWKRIIQNDLESMPMAFLVFMSAIAVGVDQTVTSGLILAYTFARIAHTVMYANEMQPHRMIAWMSGVLCILGAVWSTAKVAAIGAKP